MAHSLGIAVVAEGVEREDQLRLLHGEGCDEYQGFLCRPALDEQALIAFLQAPDRARTTAPPEIAECHGPAWPRAARA